MRKLLSILTICLCSICTAQNINIPDKNLHYALIENGVDLNKDSLIQKNEAEAIQKLELKNKKIYSLEGIQSFVNLKSLDCSENLIYYFDFNLLTKLETLNCEKNRLSTLHISKLNKLVKLNCSGNPLYRIDIRSLANLEELECRSNGLNEIIFNSQNNLSSLVCNDNQLREIDLSKLPKLKTLECANNQIRDLELESHPNIEVLNCSDNQIKHLNLIHLPKLWWLECNNNRLNDIDVNDLSNLRVLRCANNQLSSIDIQKLHKLEWLDCTKNKLIFLYLKNHKKLKRLNCSGNQITSLNLKKSPNISYLDCSNNQLISLDVSNLILLKTLGCSSNQLSTLNFKGNSKQSLDYYSYIYPNPDLKYILADKEDDFSQLSPNLTVCDTLINSQFDKQGLKTGFWGKGPNDENWEEGNYIVIPLDSTLNYTDAIMTSVPYFLIWSNNHLQFVFSGKTNNSISVKDGEWTRYKQVAENEKEISEIDYYNKGYLYKRKNINSGLVKYNEYTEEYFIKDSVRITNIYLNNDEFVNDTTLYRSGDVLYPNNKLNIHDDGLGVSVLYSKTDTVYFKFNARMDMRIDSISSPNKYIKFYYPNKKNNLGLDLKANQVDSVGVVYTPTRSQNESETYFVIHGSDCNYKVYLYLYAYDISKQNFFSKEAVKLKKEKNLKLIINKNIGHTHNYYYLLQKNYTLKKEFKDDFAYITKNAIRKAFDHDMGSSGPLNLNDLERGSYYFYICRDGEILGPKLITIE